VKVKSYSISADIIRILAVFLVIFSHTTDVFVLWEGLKGSSAWNAVYFLNTLSRVAVPVFIILSGYLILQKDKTKNYKEFLQRRFSRILIPFLFWTVVYFWWVSFWGHVKLTGQYVLQTLWSADIWHLYFLIIILELYLLAPFLVRFTDKISRRKQTVFFLGLILLSFVCAVWANMQTNRFDVAKNIVTIFIPYISYFYAGAYFRDVQVAKIKAIVFALLYIILAFITNTVAKGNMSHFVVFNYSPLLLPMSLCLFLALKDAGGFFNKKVASETFVTKLQYVSGLTFGMYLLHFLVLDVVREKFHLFPWETHTPIVFYAILPAFITFGIVFIVVAVGKKIPVVKYIFG
jgi:surface polysaccharide O-acyltransferase-like enzyme